MSLIDDIKGCFTADELPKEPIFRAVLFGDSAMYLENVKTIQYYQSEEILVCLKKGGLKICGCGLYVKKYCLGDVVICGKIKSVERV